MNHSKIEKSNLVKYLGLLTDETLNWSAHAQYLSLQFVKLGFPHLKKQNSGQCMTAFYETI